MNKLLTSIAAATMFAISYSTSASSIELPEVRLGAAYNEQVVYGNVSETNSQSSRISEQRGLFRTDSTSIFGEIAIKQLFGLTLGYEYGSDGLSNTMERVVSGRVAKVAATGSTAEEDENGTQTVNVSFDDSTTIYLLMPIMDTGFFVKAGTTETTVTTKETLFTGATYGNLSLEGDFVGAGYQHDLTDLFFVRAEGLYTEYSNGSITGSTSHTIKTKDVGSATAKFSVGIKF